MEICNKCNANMLLVSTSDGMYYSCQNCGEIRFTYVKRGDDDNNKNFTLPLSNN